MKIFRAIVNPRNLLDTTLSLTIESHVNNEVYCVEYCRGEEILSDVFARQ
jgi:hypothetical protein